MDIARRLLAGTGSLGTNRYIAGGKGGKLNQNHILDIKRQSKPTAYTYLGEQAQREFEERFKNDAQRYTKGYKALTRRTDKHLGWMHLDSGDPDFPAGYYSVFSEMAEQWAEILAADHTRANKNLPKFVHQFQLTNNQDEAFRNLAREITFSYTAQVMVDWQFFVTARPFLHRVRR